MSKKLLKIFEETGQKNPVPIWFMRQAGRYMSSYRLLRSSHSSFLDICYNPSKAAEISYLPVNEFDFDGIILFSDILVLLDSLDICVFLNKDKKNKLILDLDYAETILSDVDGFLNRSIGYLTPVFEAIKIIASKNEKGKTVIGFSGCPFTILCYAFFDKEKDHKFDKILDFIFKNKCVFDGLFDFFVKLIATYISKQIESGAEVIQLFESHSNLLSFDLFNKYVVGAIERLSSHIKLKHPSVKIIAFTKGAGVNYASVCQIEKIDCISFDQSIGIGDIKFFVKDRRNLVIQGNLDPYLLCYNLDEAIAQTSALLSSFSNHKYIFNLGHGILPNTPESNVRGIIEHIRSLEE